MAQGLDAIVQRELQSFLKDPDAYIQWVKETLNSVVLYLHFANDWFSKFVHHYEELQKDAELRLTLGELKQEARRVISILGQYVGLADFTSIADKKGESKIQAEISARLNDGETVFDFHNADSKVRDYFRCLAYFFERMITRIDALKSLSDRITAQIDKMRGKSHDCCVRCEELAANVRWHKYGAFAVTVTVGVATGGFCFLALGASGAVAVISAGVALGGGAAGVGYFQKCDKQEAKYRKLARNVEGVHNMALEMDSVASTVETKWKLCDIEGEVKDVIHISSTDLSHVPAVLTRLFSILRAVNLDKEKDTLKRISESLQEMQ